MVVQVICGLLVPFAGTSLGAAFVFFMKRQLNGCVRSVLNGFAAGVMTAASIWSLIIPAIELSEGMGVFAFVPAVAGFWIGTVILLLIDKAIPLLKRFLQDGDDDSDRLTRTAIMILAVTLHNIPEGMAVGVMYAGLLSGTASITSGGAMALAVGIAIQNLPEGAIISMPLRAQGSSKPWAFFGGMLSGVVEPVGGLIALAAAGFFVPAMPYLLSFAAGAMLYVVVADLIPEMCEESHGDLGVIMFALGFSVMMLLDVALG